jgi:hypothetical protein
MVDRLSRKILETGRKTAVVVSTYSVMGEGWDNLTLASWMIKLGEPMVKRREESPLSHPSPRRR